MRIGLIGLGRIGSFHADTLAGLPEVKSLVVADALPSVTADVVERLGCEGSDSPLAVLKAGVDGVVIAAATDAHPELLLAAVEAGIPVFCEKPVARTAAEAVKMLAAIEGSSVPVQIGYPRRFDAAFMAARAAAQAGELGRVHTIRSTTLDPAPPPDAYLAGSGGLFRDCSVHDFDAVRWVSGREVVEVYATGSSRGGRIFAELGDVDAASTILTLDDGSLGVVSNSRFNARGHDVRLEVHGSLDSVAAGWDEGVPVRSLEPDATWPSGTPYTFFMDRLAGAFRTELRTFTDVVAGTRESPCSIADALETGWVAEAATLSLAEHRPVRIEEVRL